MNNRWLNHGLTVGLSIIVMFLGGCTSDEECEAEEVRCGGECVNTAANAEHCGSCDHLCEAGPHEQALCRASACEVVCQLGYLDCNSDSADGCEQSGDHCPWETEGLCGDGHDNDEDGATDCDDPDCDEDPLCRVESECTDGVDNDEDGLSDCLDSDCLALLVCTRGCANFGLGTAVGDAILSGDTDGYGDHYQSTTDCGDDTYSGEDFAVAWTPPESGCYTIDTEDSSFDTVLRVHDGCTGPLIVCDDNSGTDTMSHVELLATEGTLYIIIVDGHSYDDEGWFELNINLIGQYCP